jgi:hypothetical protein
MQLEHNVVEEFASMESSFARPIDWNVSVGVLQPAEFVDRWRIFLLDSAFEQFFDDDADPRFFKASNLNEFGGSQSVQRVIYKF